MMSDKGKRLRAIISERREKYHEEKNFEKYTDNKNKCVRVNECISS